MKILKKMYEGLRSKKGQTVVEYALLLVLIAVVAIAVIDILGKKTNNVYNNVQAHMPAAVN